MLTPGEGRGEGAFFAPGVRNPLPEYREREPAQMPALFLSSRHVLRRRTFPVAVPCAALAVLAAACLAPSPATAQEAVTNQQMGFSVHKEKPAVMEAVEDFERFREKEAWEKAFAALGKAFDQSAGGLVPDKDGFMVDVSGKLRDELLSLPARGREAYRLFSDPTSARLLHEATDGDADASGGKASQPHDSVASLEVIVDRYFLTSSGDRAADRLGDALFESGDFARAERCWRMVLESFPGSSLPAALLQAKRATAMARGGQWAAFNELRAAALERFAGQTVHLGGRDVALSDYLQELGRDATVPAATQPAGIQPSTLSGAAQLAQTPADDTPVWQVPLMDDQGKKQITDALTNIGWQMMVGQITGQIPPTAVDGRRLYVNWFGACFAVDLATGKMLWRTNSFAGVAQTLAQMPMQGMSTDFSGAAVMAAGDRVLFARRDLSRSPQNPQNPQDAQNARTYLLCLNAESGKTIWSTEKGPGPLSGWSFVGKPLASDDGAFYICGRSGENQELSLAHVALANGELLSTVPLGTPAAGVDFRGSALSPVPVLLMHESGIYVLTNNGVLLAVDPKASRVQWAFTYPTEVSASPQVFFYNQVVPDNKAAGAMLASGTTLYFKEFGGDMIYALDLTGPSLKWKRPCDSSVTIAAGDEGNLYLCGTEADCIDAESRAMKWSDKISVACSGIRPLVAGRHVYVFGQRGMHDVQSDGGTGPIFRGYDRSGDGGALWQTDDRLITVSSAAVTAYPLKHGQRP
jgi:outer membrane protein assembly factor BamB